MSIKQIFIHINIFTFLIAIGCGNNCVKSVQFEFPIRIYPQKENYSQNDTIWIEIAINREIEDNLSGDLINVGYHDFQVDMNVLELLDSTWINGTDNFDIIPSIGQVKITGVTYPEIVPQLVQFTEDNLQKWKFGIRPKKSNADFVLLFGKRNPSGWHGEFKFLNDNCIYGIAESTFLVNEGAIDYDVYVLKFPYFTESGTGSNISQNHRESGAFFIHVE